MKGIPPKPTICKCWSKYPNQARLKRCAYYKCVEEFEWYPSKRPHKTVCVLKEVEE